MTQTEHGDAYRRLGARRNVSSQDAVVAGEICEADLDRQFEGLAALPARAPYRCRTRCCRALCRTLLAQ